MSLKAAYEQKMDAMIREWSAKIDVLKAKADKAGAEQKIKYLESIETLQTKKKKVNEKLNKLRSSGELAWEEIKGGVDKAWEDFKNSVEKAGEKFQ